MEYDIDGEVIFRDEYREGVPVVPEWSLHHTQSGIAINEDTSTSDRRITLTRNADGAVIGLLARGIGMDTERVEAEFAPDGKLVSRVTWKDGTSVHEYYGEDGRLKSYSAAVWPSLGANGGVPGSLHPA